MPIDFKALARDLRERARDVLPAWLPAGRFRGREFVVGSVQGETGDSLSVNWTTGMWADFAADLKGGDLLSLFAAINNVSMSEAARLLSGISSTPVPVQAEKVKGKEKRKIVAPAPKSAGIPPCVHYKYGPATAVYIYRDAAGAMLGAVARYDPPGMKKQVIPWTWQIDESGKGHWRMGSWDVPRPLYGLDDLAARPNQPVLIVEGEKCADAARMLMPQYVCMTWVGGGHNHRYVDFSPLKGRRILLWPDNDHDGSGITAMWAVGYKLLRICREVKIIIPGSDLPDKWDVADAIKQDGFNNSDANARWQYFKAWALPLIEELKEDFSDVEQKGSGAAGENGRVAGGVAQERHDAAVPNDDGADVSAGSEMANSDGGRTARDTGEQPVRRDSDDDVPSGVAVDGVGDRPADKDSARRGAKARKTQGTRAVFGSGEKSADGDTVAKNAGGSDASEVPRLRREIYWLRWAFDMSGNGTPLQNLSNAVATLERDPEWQGKIWYDTFLQRIVADVPGGNGPRMWADFDDVNLTLYMQRAISLKKISTEIVGRAVVQIARSNLKNCVTDWMDTLRWDGEPRIEMFFEDHFGAKSSTYTRAVSRNFWMSVVARAYIPGCKQDYMVVLEGLQGRRKSMAIESICHDPGWFGVALEDIDSKDFFQTLLGKLLIEIGELEAFNRRGDMNRVKNVVSCAKDVFRGSYERHASDHPRQCVFVGTTNRDDWNKDETGARRFWPIRVNGDIDVEAIAAAREQLFAEAVARLKKLPFDAPAASRMAAGADWWVIPTEEAEEEQRARFEDDSWKGDVEDFVGLKTEVRLRDILVDGLKIDVGKIKRPDEMRVGAILRVLGWEVRKVRVGLNTYRAWFKKEGSSF